MFGMQGMGAPFNWYAVFPLLSLGVVMCAAYGAFRLRSHGLLGFAILSALLHLARFYYLYGTTLLWKSLIMLCLGVLLLALGLWLQRRESPTEAA
jgi:uncharacterized membrane protein